MRLVLLFFLFFAVSESEADVQIQRLSVLESTDIVRQQIAAGYDINARFEYNNTPLIDATMFGRTEVVKLLIEAGAKVDLVNNSGSTALHESATMGDLDITKILVEAGANVNKSNDYKSTPLRIAATKGHLKIAQFLISKGADVNAVDRRGYSVLNRVRNWTRFIPYREEVEKLLIQHGAVDVSTFSQKSRKKDKNPIGSNKSQNSNPKQRTTSPEKREDCHDGSILGTSKSYDPKQCRKQDDETLPR